jgi:hypothetical protein
MATDTDRLADMIRESDLIDFTPTERLLLAQRLIARGVTMPAEPLPEPPPLHCSWCGRTDPENRREGYGGLTDIRVIVAEAEEGQADVMRLACYEHLEVVAQQLGAIGFFSHRHGGINYLEPMACPGYLDMKNCPTPDPED